MKGRWLSIGLTVIGWSRNRSLNHYQKSTSWLIKGILEGYGLIIYISRRRSYQSSVLVTCSEKIMIWRYQKVLLMSSFMELSIDCIRSALLRPRSCRWTRSLRLEEHKWLRESRKRNRFIIRVLVSRLNFRLSSIRLVNRKGEGVSIINYWFNVLAFLLMDSNLYYSYSYLLLLTKYNHQILVTVLINYSIYYF